MTTTSSPSNTPPPSIPTKVEVIATLLVDPHGRVREGASSRALSSEIDRTRFLAFRSWGACIVVGGATYRAENYRTARLPVEVFSTSIRKVDDWKGELDRLKSEYGRRILVEAGPGLLHQLLEADLIDRLYLTRTNRISGDLESPIFNVTLLGPEHGMALIESTRVGQELFETFQSSRLT